MKYVLSSMLAAGFAAGVICSVTPAARAATSMPAPIVQPAPGANIILAADGCGPGWYRGPYGACHAFGTGPYPGGYWGPRQYYRPYYAYNGYFTYNGCPAGYWRGPLGAPAATRHITARCRAAATNKAGAAWRYSWSSAGAELRSM